ncbi:MAG: DUF4258 domain-containing protein [Deltaproteobacteria bacterium]|nr:DUF4258 domain-containing protein [Deltaproteobacteria bacterium]
MKTKLVIKKWLLLPHAVQRMEERRISLEEVNQIISEPDSINFQGPKIILSKYFKIRNDNLIAAVLIEKKEKDLWPVITVMVHFEER